MTNAMEIKVVLEQTALNGSAGSDIIQRVATVYIEGAEYRVSAPPKAKGPALDWVRHFSVREWDKDGSASDVEVQGSRRETVVQAVEAELKSQRAAEGLHPDGVHCSAQICRKGHVQHCDGATFNSAAHCPKCGAESIDQCLRCGEPIRGVEKYQSTDTYQRPAYCHVCGSPYPWMEDRLQTARELLYHDEKLTMDDRLKLFDLLQEVMSDPAHSLAPAKKKLIEVNLERAAKTTRELILDLLAKTAAETIKG